MSFSFSFVAKKRERKERKERENTLPLPTLLRVFNKMDVAGEPALSRSLSQLNAARSRRRGGQFEWLISFYHIGEFRIL